MSDGENDIIGEAPRKTFKFYDDINHVFHFYDSVDVVRVEAVANDLKRLEMNIRGVRVYADLDKDAAAHIAKLLIKDEAA